MAKLESTGKLYHSIVFILWRLLEYYSILFNYDAGECATDGFDCKFFPSRTLSKIRVTVPIIKEAEHPPHNVRQMRTILNEYLQLLLQDSDVPPYAVSKNDFIESLYVTDVVTDENICYQIDFLYVNDNASYEYMIQNEQKYMERSNYDY